MDNTVRQGVMSFEGLGKLRFGMSRVEVRNLLGDDFESFKRNQFATSETEVYPNLGFYLDYDASGSLELIEATEPCIPQFQGIDLVGEVNKVVENLERTGVSGEPDEVGYIYEEAGFGLHVTDDTIEAVSVFAKGYYD